MIGDGVVAAAAGNGVGAAAAVDGVVAGTAGDDVGADRTRQRSPPDDSAEASTFWKLATIVGVADRLVGRGEVDVRRGLQLQRVDAGAAIDRRFGAVIGDGIVAAPGADDVGAAAAVDGVVAGTGRDRVGEADAVTESADRQRAGVEVFEIRDVDVVAGGLVDVGRDGEIDRGGPARGRQHQRIGSGAAVDRGFGAVIGHGIVAGAAGDDVGAAAAVDGVVAGAAGDGVGGRRARDRHRRGQRRRVDVLEIGDAGGVADGLVRGAEIDVRRRAQHQRVGAGTAVDRGFSAVIGDAVVARARADGIGATGAVDGVVAGARRDDVGGGRTGDRDRRGQCGGVDVLEVRYAGGVARGLVGVAEIDRGDGVQHQRIAAGATVDRYFRSRNTRRCRCPRRH